MCKSGQMACFFAILGICLFLPYFPLFKMRKINSLHLFVPHILFLFLFILFFSSTIVYTNLATAVVVGRYCLYPESENKG